MTALRDAAMNSKAWPFEEARALLKRYEKKAPEKGYVLFETGYGPSGLPHIGTFGEVARTTMIRRAFEIISDIPTRLICFSDDVDGMRKVPENVPQQEMLRQHMQKPLTSVPDPYGEYREFRRTTTTRCCGGFWTRSGSSMSSSRRPSSTSRAGLTRRCGCVRERYDAIMAIMLASSARGAAADLFLLPADPSGDGAGDVCADEGGECQGWHDHL